MTEPAKESKAVSIKANSSCRITASCTRRKFVPVTVTGALVGFLIFRVLDVIKPWPSARFEALPGGLGVMADDAMAAIYGNLVMQVLVRIAPHGWLT